MVFASILCGAGTAGAFDAVSSDVIAGFGLFRTYSTDHPVILRADGEPYYAGTTKFVGYDIGFAAQIKNGYSGDMPNATLTFMDSGLRTILTPEESSGDLYTYTAQGQTLSELAGQRVMWNLYTSPDVVVGAAVMPNVSALSEDISAGAIVPYVKLNHENGRANHIGRVDLYFVKSGDSAPAALGDSVVKVYLNGSSLNSSAPDYEFTNFSKPVRNSFYLDYDESELRSMTVEYIKNGTKYIWNFVPAHGTYSSIEWGKLALENQPLTLKTGESLDIEVKIPARIDLSSYFDEYSFYDESDFLEAGNYDVLSWQEGSLSFDQGSASWDGLTYKEKKSVLSFTLTAGEPGRTALKVYIPNVGSYLREVHVTDESGDLALYDEVPEGMFLQVSEYKTRARFVNGRPWYPSAENSGISYSLVVSGDFLPYKGFFGITNGAVSELHEIYSSWDNEAEEYTGSYSIDIGPRYSTADSADNTEHHTLSLTDDDIEKAGIWLNFPDDDSFNVVSASLKSIFSGDCMTTTEQLENFVPYFEMTHASSDVNNVVSLDWCFVNPKTMEKVAPDVSNVSINSSSAEGTSGTLSGISGWSVVFQYDYKGVTYIWNFEDMEYNDYASYIHAGPMKAGTTRTAGVLIEKYTSIDSIDVNIWDKDVLSADPVSFASNWAVSFDLYGISEGTTRLAFVYTRKDYTSYDRYVQGYKDITVYSADSAAVWTPESIDLTPYFEVNLGACPVVEGTPIHNSTEPVFSARFDLNSNTKIPLEYYYDYVSPDVKITLHIYSGDTETVSYDNLSPAITREYDDYGTEYVTKLSYATLSFSRNITRIEWTSSGGIITSGSSDITASKTLNYRPFIKLNKEGLNISTLEYYFVNSNDNKIDTPKYVSDISITLWGFSNISNEDESGIMALNIPETFIIFIVFRFTDNGITYYSGFSPVNRPGGDLNSGDVISWDVKYSGLPLIMTVGESLDMAITAPNIADPVPYIGSKAIISMDVLSSADYTVKVRFTAKAAGMTSIVLVSAASSDAMTLAREIWVADSEGKVPHLTRDGTIEDIIEKLTSKDIASGSSGGWYEYNDLSSAASRDVESGIKTTDPVEVLAGLSVYPRYALPTDPSGDTYSKAWDMVYDENLPYSAYMFEDEVEVLASRDVTEVFSEVSADLIMRYPAQILAVVLPEIKIQAEGIYTFRIPTDNITRKGTKIFMYTNLQTVSDDDTYMNCYTDDGEELEYISGDEYINIAVYLESGEYAPIITAEAVKKDIYLIKKAAGLLPPLELKASPVSMSIALPAAGTVTLKPINAIGTAAYTANHPWVTFSGNTAVFSPAAAGTYSVIITAKDSDGRTAEVTIRVTATSSTPAASDDKPASKDVKPPVSRDKTPSGQGGSSSDGEKSASVVVTPPSVSIQDTAIKQKIVSLITAIVSFITGDIEILGLPEGSVGVERFLADLSSDELASLSDGENIAVILPLISVDKPAVYVFGVDLSGLQAGTPIYLHTAAKSAAAQTAVPCMCALLDAYGNETDTVPANQLVNIAAYMEPEYTYAFIITTSSYDIDTPEDSGSAGGGCDSGFSFIVLAVLGLTAKKRLVK